MNVRTISKALAFVAAASLAACAAGTPNSTLVPGNAPHGNPIVGGSAILTTMVGMGDSLTAGEQSGGVFGGLPGQVQNPLATGIPPLQALGVPPTQQNGYWSVLYQQAKGVTWIQMSTPSTTVLPLISAPGLGDQIVPANPALTGGIPFGTIPTRSACDGFNSSAFNLASLGEVRENPNGSISDIAIPGITMHEALTMTLPISPQCAPLPGVNAQIAGLQSVVNGESGFYYPILGQFQRVTHPSMLNVAVSMRPTLTTVWLGANDILKFIFSGGQFAAGNLTEASAQTDMTQIITSLQNVGSRVVVADIPMVLETPQFASVAIPPPAQITQACELQTYLFCLLVNDFGQSPAQAGATVAAVSTAYNLGTTGYLTESGLINLLQGKNLDPSGPGTGLGSNYITPAFATQINSVNTAMNAGIAAAAKQTGTPLVPISQVFNDIATGNTSSPSFQLAASVNPGKCCTLTFGGGLLSYDGLHPSNTGYAVIADAFISAIDTAYGANIPPLALSDVQAIYGGTQPATRVPYPDPYAQH